MSCEAIFQSVARLRRTVVKNSDVATDFGRISWQEFKGGSDITEGGIMFVDRDKKSCAEPHRVHGSLLFRDSEPKEGEKRFVRVRREAVVSS